MLSPFVQWHSFSSNYKSFWTKIQFVGRKNYKFFKQTGETQNYRGCRKIIKLDDRAAPLLYIMKKFGCDPFVLGIVADFRHTLIKLLYFLAFMLFLLPGKDDSQYVHFEFLHAVC